MPDVDEKIRIFLATIGTKYTVSRSAIAEIEDHIRQDLEHFGSDQSRDVAIDQVLAKFGESEHLSAEFAKLTGSRRSAKIFNLLSHLINGRVIMRLFIGIFLGMFFIIGGMLLEGGQIVSITQITAFLIVIGGASGGVLVTYPFGDIKRAVVLALTGRNAVESQYLSAGRVFRSFGDMALYAGAIGFAMGLIHVFEHSKRYPESIGPGMAVAVVAILYALFTKLFIGRALSDSFFMRAKATRIDDSGHDDLAAA